MRRQAQVRHVRAGCSNRQFANAEWPRSSPRPAQPAAPVCSAAKIRIAIRRQSPHVIGRVRAIRDRACAFSSGRTEILRSYGGTHRGNWRIPSTSRRASPSPFRVRRQDRGRRTTCRRSLARTGRHRRAELVLNEAWVQRVRPRRWRQGVRVRHRRHRAAHRKRRHYAARPATARGCGRHRASSSFWERHSAS